MIILRSWLAVFVVKEKCEIYSVKIVVRNEKRETVSVLTSQLCQRPYACCGICISGGPEKNRGHRVREADVEACTGADCKLVIFHKPRRGVVAQNQGMIRTARAGARYNCLVIVSMHVTINSNKVVMCELKVNTFNRSKTQ